MFANPPFSMMEQVVRKGVKDKALMILVLPEWKKPIAAFWFKLAMQHARKQYQIKQGQQVFQKKDGSVAPPTRWDTWGILFDGAWCKKWDEPLLPQKNEKGEWREQSKAKERRELRKKAKQRKYRDNDPSPQ
jgi:hypothetical protein